MTSTEPDGDELRLSGDEYAVAAGVAGWLGLTPVATLRDAARKLVKLSELHSPYGIYDECPHEHSPEEIAAGGAIDCGDFSSCAPYLVHWACAHCCTDAQGCQTEECFASHDHGKGRPRCKTAAILDGDGDD